MSTYKNAVCRGSIFLKTGCGHCERCKEEQARIAEKSDTHEAEKLDSHAATKLSDWKAGEDMTVFTGGKIDTSSITIAGIKGLPVAGYKKVQPPHLIALVNQNKVLEEKILRQIDLHVQRGAELDQRSVQMARGLIEDAFMRLNRGVFQPQRLEGDLE
ncbi:hypothetical protein B1VFA_066 [Rhizobium phage B1VFA]|nr:hypothetical protein B1VFA_066 [Rhizobium phage B1VFA]